MSVNRMMNIHESYISKRLENIGFPPDIAEYIVTYYKEENKIDGLIEYIDLKTTNLHKYDSVPLNDR